MAFSPLSEARLAFARSPLPGAERALSVSAKGALDEGPAGASCRAARCASKVRAAHATSSWGDAGVDRVAVLGERARDVRLDRSASLQALRPRSFTMDRQALMVPRLHRPT